MYLVVDLSGPGACKAMAKLFLLLTALEVCTGRNSCDLGQAQKPFEAGYEDSAMTP